MDDAETPSIPVISTTAESTPRRLRLPAWRGRLEAIALPTGAILVSMVLFGIFCALNGAPPLEVFASIHKASFGSWYSFQNTLVRAAPLMLCSLCTAIPFRLGFVIIGNEGALVLGGLCATMVGLKMPEATPFHVQLAMASTGMLAGGLWIMAAGALKVYRGVNETISTLLMNYIAIALLSQSVNSWIKDPESLNKPSSLPIPDEQMFQPPTLPEWVANKFDIPAETTLHWGLLFGIVACVIAWFLIQKTTFGFQVRTIGANIRAARVAGLAVGPVTLVACFLGGVCPGLAGMVEVAAIHGRANESLNAGYGYSGILVAFLARQNPLGCIVIAVLLGGLLASGGILQRTHHLPDATILVCEGIVFLVILFSESLYGRWKFFQNRSA
jgi:general nucleoside transport system permease protein